jgi:hypothetical protein
MSCHQWQRQCVVPVALTDSVHTDGWIAQLFTIRSLVSNFPVWRKPGVPC